MIAVNTVLEVLAQELDEVHAKVDAIAREAGIDGDVKTSIELRAEEAELLGGGE